MDGELPMETLLKVSNLSIGIRKGKNLLSSVESITYNIKAGEILGIVGESGSGKTLTALSIPGLLGENKIITTGSILFKGKNLLSASEKELESIRGNQISMIFQEPFSSLNPLMKIGDQIAETLKIHGEKDTGAIKLKVMDHMEKLGLHDPEKLAETYPHRLSGGMCQRVMIALAIICRPRLLIADEPTTALDQKTQSQITSLLKEINNDMGTSILFISHDLEVIKNLCDRVMVMYSGRILEAGKTDEVFYHPAHEYTRGLLNSIPSRKKRGMDLTSIPGRIPSLEEGRPRGCPFHPRCVKAKPGCKEDFAPAKSLSATHTSHCILSED